MTVKRVDPSTIEPTKIMQKADFTQEEYWRNLVESSLSRLLILYILSNGPNYGYAIRKRIEKVSHGLCTISEGGLYPALHSLCQAGLLDCVTQKFQGRKRRVYYITPKAKQSFDTGIKVWRKVVPLLEEIYRKRRGFRRIKVE